jgi:putative copper export protein
MNILTTLPLVAWEYGILLIGVFALVVILLVVVVLNMMKNDKKGE